MFPELEVAVQNSTYKRIRRHQSYFSQSDTLLMEWHPLAEQAQRELALVQRHKELVKTEGDGAWEELEIVISEAMIRDQRASLIRYKGE
jgi:hypothetical protein